MMKKQYMESFVDSKYPEFINKYLNTKSLKRLQNVTQFCGCDYTKLYNPLFKYTRYDHSIVVANMTWHFTHNKKETIVALLHDIGTPVFSHTIDYVFGDYIKQESSEKSIEKIILNDNELLHLLEQDGLAIDDFKDLSIYKILENKKPHLCTDRLDGVLHTVYVWLHKVELEEVKQVYNDIIVLKNENGENEIGFKNINMAEKFSKMVYIYATELQGNRDKYVMKYISDLIKKSVEKDLIDIDFLYNCQEKDVIEIFRNNFSTWKYFENAESIVETNVEPNCYYASFETKKRNTIPLVYGENENSRINLLSNVANNLYKSYENHEYKKYGYISNIGEIV